jgi:signal recognition particle subunit SEC65
MNQLNRPTPDNEKPKPGSPLEEALRIIEEYANDLREIIKKLRRRLN